MKYINEIIMRYKRIRNRQHLKNIYSNKYAFVGIGGHSVNNLYPVLYYLGVPFKYICCKSQGNVELIKKRTDIMATTSLADIMTDDEIKGVFVSVSVDTNFEISKKVLDSGKSLFVEKPPCRSKKELDCLIDLADNNKVAVTMVGVQKRYSPIMQTLCRRLKGERCLSYNMKYLTGLYPEGEALLDLFIHPLDCACFLFGKAKVTGIDYVRQSNGALTLMLLLTHKNAKGMVELSTGYTWANAIEQLTINTKNGVYVQDQMENLKFYHKSGSIFGIPVEKIVHRSPVVVELYGRNNFVPTIANNQIHTQGYFNEIKTFVDAVEYNNDSKVCSSLRMLENTYDLIGEIRKML